MTTEPERPPSAEFVATSGPQIWVGSLSDYNAGVLYGNWMGGAREPEQIHDDIAALLAKSPTAADEGTPAEEWGIFDYEGFGELHIGEYDSIERVSHLASRIAEHGPAYAAWASLGHHRDSDDLDQTFEDAYRGRFDSVVEYVEQFIDDMGYEELLDQAVPAGIRPYVTIRTEALARDLELSGDVYAPPSDDGGVWLFEGNV